jgi:hypothetical protein
MLTGLGTHQLKGFNTPFLIVGTFHGFAINGNQLRFKR